MSLEGFSMRPLAAELSAALIGGRIDKITQPNKHSVILSVRQPGRNSMLQLSVNPQNPSLHIIAKPLENPPEPPVFCMVLRKYIETGRIADIRQHGLDRLFFIDIDTIGAKGSIVTRTLVIELMGKYSNIILLENNIIIDALRKIGQNSSRARTVLPGQEYELPPAQDKLNLFAIPLEEVLTRLQGNKEKKLFSALMDTCLGFGPITAREAAFSAGLSSDILIGELEPIDFKAIGDALTELCRLCTEKPSPCLLLGENKKLIAMAAFPIKHKKAESELSFPTLSEMLEVADRLIGSYVLPDKDRFKKLIKNELHRAVNKIDVLNREIEDAENAEEWRFRADNLMTCHYQFRDHADSEITVTDIYSETGEKITIPLDKRLTLIQNMQACYKKYDKLKRAQTYLLEQLEKCEEEVKYLSSIDSSLESSSSFGEIAEIHNELVSGGYLKEKPRKKNNDKPAQPFSFKAADGTEILVGKNNYQNDRLTFKTAAYNDIWLHTKEIPGSHVILRSGGESPNEETLLLAAQLAVHFSQAKSSSKVPVDYTECRYVKKPSGAKPGFVIFTNQHTLYITPDEEMLEAVLKLSSAENPASK